MEGNLNIAENITFTVHDGENVDVSIVGAGILNNAGNVTIDGATLLLSGTGKVTGKSVEYTGSTSELKYDQVGSITTSDLEFSESKGPANLTIYRDSDVTLHANRTLLANFSVSESSSFEVDSRSLTVSGNATVSGTLSISTGTVDVDGTFNAEGGSVTFTDTGLLKLGGSVTDLGTLTDTHGTVEYDGGAQSIFADTYNNLTLSGSGIKKASSLLTVNNDLTTATEVTLDSTDLTVSGTINNSGTIQVSGSVNIISTSKVGGTFIYDGSSQSIDSGNAYEKLYITGDGTVSSVGTLTADNLTVSTARLDVENLRVNTLLTNSSIIEASGSVTIPNMAVGTFIYNGASQAVDNAIYDNLTLSGSKTKTLAGDIEVNNDLTISKKIALDTKLGRNYDIDIKGDFVNNGTFIANLSDVIFSGSSRQKITSGNSKFYNIELSNSEGSLLKDNLRISNKLTLTDGLLTLDSSDLIFEPKAVIEGDFSSSSMIETNSTGKVIKYLNKTGEFLFPVGTNVNGAAAYSPMTLNFTEGKFDSSAYASVGVKNIKHPENTSKTSYLNRYWSVKTEGIKNFSSNVTCEYLPSDTVGDETAMYGGKYSSEAWTLLNKVNTKRTLFSNKSYVFLRFHWCKSGYYSSTSSTSSTSAIGN